MQVKLTLWFILTLVFISPAQADNKSLILGVIPYVTTSKIIMHNNIVRKHLNETTEYDISLVSAKNLNAYIENLKSYKYDIILSAPHLARFVEKEYNYKRVAMSSHTIQGVYITKKSAPLSSTADIKGKVVSLISPKTLIHQMVLEQAVKDGINADTDIKIKQAKTFNNAIYDVINGYSDVTVTGIKIWGKLPSKVKKGLKKIGQTKPTSGFIILAKPELSEATVKTIQSSLLAFNNTQYSKKYIFQGFRLINNNDMESLDFHAKIFK